MPDHDDALRGGITIKEMMDEFGVTLDEAKALRARLDQIQQELDERGYVVFKRPNAVVADPGEL
jgi:hypothetical protein